MNNHYNQKFLETRGTSKKTFADTVYLYRHHNNNFKQSITKR